MSNYRTTSTHAWKSTYGLKSLHAVPMEKDERRYARSTLEKVRSAFRPVPGTAFARMRIGEFEDMVLKKQRTGVIEELGATCDKAVGYYEIIVNNKSEMRDLMEGERVLAQQRLARSGGSVIRITKMIALYLIKVHYGMENYEKNVVNQVMLGQEVEILVGGKIIGIFQDEAGGWFLRNMEQGEVENP